MRTLRFPPQFSACNSHAFELLLLKRSQTSSVVKTMNNRSQSAAAIVLSLIVLWVSPGRLLAQNAPQFAPVQRLTNNEMVLKLSASNGFYRIDAATNLPQWDSLLTLLNTNGSL